MTHAPLHPPNPTLPPSVDDSEERHKEDERLFRSLFETHSAVQLLVDPLSGAIVDANDAAARYYGWSRPQLRQMRIQDLDALSPEEMKQEMEQADARQCPSYEFRHRRADGSIRDVAVFSGHSAPENRGLLHFFIQDITDHHQRAAQLRQARKMEAIGRLAEGVAHDFKNMLQVILGSTELIRMQLGDASPVQSELDDIQNAARRSTEMARHLLAFARKQTLSPQRLDLNGTIDGLLKILRRLIGENIELTWRPGKDAGIVQMDPSQIDQILATLCVNARDSISDIGQIAIETSKAVFDSAHPPPCPEVSAGEFTRMTVRDSGRGMDPASIAHLFDPRSDIQGLAEESSLGLSTVHGIALQNGGCLAVDSPPGQGTAVHVYLPRFSDDAPAVAPPPSLARGNETILLVEDEPSVLLQTEKILLQLGYRVLATASPDEAMQLAQNHDGDIHLLLADVVMPRMDGRNLARAIQTLQPRAKALFISGYPANIVARYGVIDDGSHFLSKPFSSDELAVHIRKALA